MKKRGLALALALSLCLGLLSGCQEKDTGVKLDSKNPVTISIWHYYNGAQKAAFDQMVQEFNESVGMEQGIVVEAFNYGNVSQLIESVVNSANNKVGTEPIPNIFAAYADTAYQIDKLDLVVDLGQYLTEEEIAQYIPSYIEEGRLGEDHALKIFPTAKSSEVFIVNKTDWDKFAQDTGASLDSLDTLEGLAKVAEQYYAWTDSLTPDIREDGKAFFGRDAMANYFIIGCKQLGVEIFSVENGEVSFQIDPSVMRRLWDNYYLPYINGYYGAYGRFRSDDVKVGDIIALVGSTSSVTYFPDSVTINDQEPYSIEAAVLPTPAFEGGEPYAVQQGAGMVVTKSTPEQEYASVVFLKWFTEAERNIRFSAGSGYLPVKIAANEPEYFAAVVDEALAGTNPPAKLTDTLKIALEAASVQKLYTNRAFEGGTDARNVLENSMSRKAAEDAAKVQQLVDTGMSRKEAAAQFDTDENFESWLVSLQAALAETQKGK